MKSNCKIKNRQLVFILFLHCITRISSGNPDSLLIGNGTDGDKQISFLFTSGYRVPLNKNRIINSGHGVYMEGGINAGGLIAENCIIGVYGGFAMQGRFWSTSFEKNFSDDYTASIKKDQSLSGLDSAIVYSSAGLFKNIKGSAAAMPGCATRSFHNYSLYYGLVFRLPSKYSPVLKLYMGNTRTHYQGDGNIVTQQKEYNIFRLYRTMQGCELGFSRILGHGKNKSGKLFSGNGNSVGLSIYYETCNFYGSSLYFDDGEIKKRIPLQHYTTASFLMKYKREFYCGMKLFFCIW